MDIEKLKRIYWKIWIVAGAVFLIYVFYIAFYLNVNMQYMMKHNACEICKMNESAFKPAWDYNGTTANYTGILKNIPT